MCSSWLLQSKPQEPHDSTLVLVFVSHPLVVLFESQSAKPTLHVLLQLPLVQLRVTTLLPLQTVGHPSQWSASFCVLISQPFVSLLPSQSAKFVAHVPLQRPPPQVRLAMFAFEHAWPQEPQLSALVAVLISHPLARLSPSQSAYPLLQAPDSQLPPEQAAVMFAVEQAIPQPPQWVASSCSEVSHPFVSLLPSQSAKLVAQVPLQRLAAQVGEAMLLLEQTFEQPPHLFGSPTTFVSQPSAAPPAQSAQPVSQVETVQVPLLQPVALTLGSEPQSTRLPQVVPHVLPELKLISQPLATLVSQFPCPDAQVVIPQAPPLQVVVPTSGSVVQFTRLPQAVPQVVVAEKSTSQPFVGSPSQLPNPGEQVTVQVPEPHVPPDVFGRLVQLTMLPHAEPHVASTLKFVSQPSPDETLQLPKPASQVAIVQLEEPQEAVATCGRYSQTTPQSPQLFLSLAMFVAQPVGAPPEQALKPRVQLV